MIEIDTEILFEELKKARDLSYSPYSNFRVGAVVLTKDGKYILGTNIENASYPLCMCAERNAIYRAYLEGYNRSDIVCIAIYTETENYISPCGACRQVMQELLSKNTPIYLFSKNGSHIETNIEELLPFSFSGDDLQWNLVLLV